MQCREWDESAPLTVTSIIERLLHISPTPLMKQAPSSLLYGVAVILIATIPGVHVPDPVAIIVGSVMVIVGTLLAAVITASSRLSGIALLVPAIDFLAIAVLGYGTGANGSLFGALLILPVVWVASEDGQRFIGYAAVGIAGALVFPLLPWQFLNFNPMALIRDSFTAVMFIIGAIAINQLAAQARQRLLSVERFAAQSERLLEGSLLHARKLAESEANVRQAQRTLRGVWQAVTEQAVIGSDITGLIDAFNPGAERMLGLSAEDAEDKLHIDEFHVPDELEERARELDYPAGATVLNPGFSALVESARLGNADVREWTWVKRDGSTMIVDLSVTRRVNEDGDTVGYLFVANDVTKAREVARLKDEFVGLISHELRTPLSSILGYLELMRDDDDPPLSAVQLKYLGVAERNAHRLLRLVGDLLFTAQVESGKFQLDERELDPSSILLASVETVRPTATAADITLVAEVEEGQIVHADAVRLGQACDNLMSNAIKFTPKGGTVTIGLAHDGTNALITVTDTGMGIPASELDQMFSRFFRATTATRNAVPGVGLGLTITRAIVRAHGGELSVESEEGVGTAFTMTLPLAAPATARIPM